MAADSDGSLTAVVICEGNLHDPEFPRRFRHLLSKLKFILQQPKRSKKLKVNKVEPWNSVRVTLSIPKEAAAKLRQLAAEGSSALRALGILSVQLEGDTVISLRLVGQDLVLRTDNTTTGCVQEAGSSSNALGDLTQILASRVQQTTAGQASSSSLSLSIPPGSISIPPSVLSSSTPTLNLAEPIAGPSSRLIPQSPVAPPGPSVTPTISLPNPAILNGPGAFDKPPIFKSPNTVCPMDGKLPVPPLTNIVETREYPFESMTQARVIQRRENTMAVVAALGAGPQQNVTTAASAPLVIGGPQNVAGQQSQVTPPPLAIPVTPTGSDTSQPTTPQQQQAPPQVVKSQFMQPPPPPYPTAGTTNHIKPPTSGHTIQHPIIQSPQSNTIAMANNTNALSSPLLVNLLQNDGVGQIKPPPSPVVLQSQQQQQSIPSGASLISNITNHNPNDGVLLLNNSSTDSSSISLSPSIPVPSSSQTQLSNIASASPVPIVPSGTGGGAVLTANIVGPLQQTMPPGIRVQQQRFPVPQQQGGTPSQQAHLLRQHQIIHATGAGGNVQLQRFPATQQPGGMVGSAGGPTMVGPIVGGPQTFRHPQPGPIGAMPQQYNNTPQSSHPGLVNHQPTQVQSQPQQMLVNNFNHPRWPFKPMDSATKSSFQEFTRYQLQYNLQQEMNNQSAGVTVSPDVARPAAIGEASASGAGSSTSTTKSSGGIGDALGLSSYLDGLSKTDLDSLLLPNLDVSDLDSALDLDGKNAFESLLDAKDIELDLMDPEGIASSVNPALDLGGQPPTTSASLQIASQQTAVPNVTATDNKNNISLTKAQHDMSASGGKQRQLLINPLTGELEPMPSEEESETEELPADSMDVLNEFNSEMSNSLFSDDENSCSTAFSKASDHSDTERSSNSEASGRSRYSKSKKERRDSSTSKKSKQSMKSTLLREKLHQGIKDRISGKSKQSKEKVTTKAKLIAIDGKDSPSEKIKLRLKLEKAEPVSPAYKVDVSFVSSPKKPQSGAGSGSGSLQSPSLTTTPNSSPSQLSGQSNPNQSPLSEEPRVPPLHISLRGKNSIVIKNSKKDRKKSQGGPDDGISDESYQKKAIAIINRFVASNDSQSNMVKANSQGKPITRPSLNDEYPVSNSHAKSVLENGEDAEKVSSKRNASDIVHASPNGMLSPEVKRRRMSQSLEQPPSIHQALEEKNTSTESYNHLQNPIGSTNVGTLPQHSSLSKNQQQKAATNNNNNKQVYSNKIHKNVIKSGKPLVVIKASKSPPTIGVVKDPGKSPPVTSSEQLATTLSSAASQATPTGLTTTTTAGSVAANTTSNKLAICLLPQGSTDSISKEKFKQKLLEFQSSVKQPEMVVSLVSNTSTSNNTDIEQILQSTTVSKASVVSSVPPMATVSATTTKSVASSPLDEKSHSVSHSVDAAPTSSSAPSDNTSLVEILQDQKVDRAKEESAIVSEQLPTPAPLSHQPTINDVAINLLNNGTNNVRNSPGSQAQGEDSGIESMDALSEKSPHQSASPQQSDTTQQPQKSDSIVDATLRNKMSKKTDSPSPASLRATTKSEPDDEITNIRDIEAALAKMEGLFPPTNEPFLASCESPMPKLNGDHSMKEESLLENLTDEKIMLCAAKIEQEEDLAAIMGNTSGKSTPIDSKTAVAVVPPKAESRDLNENKEISSKISLETQLNDECCKKSLKPNTTTSIKSDDTKGIPTTESTQPSIDEKKQFEENVIMKKTAAAMPAAPTKPSEIEVKPVIVLIENVKAEKYTASTVATAVAIKSEPSEQPVKIIPDVIGVAVVAPSDPKPSLDLKEMLTPITIEIPSQNDSEAPRIRTRASTKLESPLDAPPKQSPQLDSPANCLKSNFRLSAAAIERLSPKMGAAVAAKGTSTASAAATPTTPISLSVKRKRQGSESSTQSCVSDDTPGGGRSNSSSNSSTTKRARPNSSSSTETIMNHSTGIGRPAAGAIPIATKKTTGNRGRRAADESSDSDEPLIEVAGKVRNSKGPGRPPASDRNHRLAMQNRSTTHFANSTGHPTSSIAAQQQQQHQQQHPTTVKTIRGVTTSLQHSSTNVTNYITVTAATTHLSNSNNSHSTRGSGTNSTASTSSAQTSNHTNMAASQASTTTVSSTSVPSVQDDKIGTRRSVRASAAANKIIYSRGGLANSNESNKAGPNVVKGSAAGGDNHEPRRKTRSAAGVDTTTDGRRRRGSRDSK